MDFVPQPVRLKGMPVPAHPWSILKASAEQGEAAAAASLLPARFFRACHACATYGEAGDHYQFFQTLFLQAPWGAPVATWPVRSASSANSDSVRSTRAPSSSRRARCRRAGAARCAPSACPGRSTSWMTTRSGRGVEALKHTELDLDSIREFRVLGPGRVVSA